VSELGDRTRLTVDAIGDRRDRHLCDPASGEALRHLQWLVHDQEKAVVGIKQVEGAEPHSDSSAPVMGRPAERMRSSSPQRSISSSRSLRS
jgi:hypothetical protein